MQNLPLNNSHISVPLPEKFRKYFWEYNGIELNIKSDSKLIAERILKFGNPEAVKWLLNNVSENFLRNIIANSKNLDDKTVNYWNMVLNE